MYIHIPFCIQKCSYCDFYSITDLALEREFVKALKHEMNISCHVPFKFDTLYIGGGTPSVLKTQHIRQIIDTARRLFTFLPDTEITLEANPRTVTPSTLSDYYKMGINRINIGVQSFHDKNLQFLSRIHSADDARLALQWTRKTGFDNIGMDLMYGIPGQSEASWLSDLHTAVEFNPAHLSCYMLTYEPSTPLTENQKKGLFHPLSDHLTSILFETTIEFLSDHGYMQYEISNFARSAAEMSKHNRKYWACIPYRGFGPSAHSFTEPVRYWNHRSVKKYIRDISVNKLPIAEKETLTREQQMIEAVYVGLRTTEGIDTINFNKKFDTDFKILFHDPITILGEKGLIQTDQNQCCLSQKGMLFLDSITAMFVRSL